MWDMAHPADIIIEWMTKIRNEGTQLSTVVNQYYILYIQTNYVSYLLHTSYICLVVYISFVS